MTAEREEPDTSVTTAEMLAIRETVRSKLVHELHTYQMTARLHRRVHNIPAAQMDEARVRELKSMLKHLEDEDEPAQGTPIRLRD